ncbi:uncharacterized protein LOC117324633 [Pecten maximus]|uniref:uncharacterized protein LOC117324633 n=1 Tax=Pecten maximus TaxID=6579 RepID=UPI0014591AE5|nr:uncharacterized protein LOC117324633 [Pecten maximus]
MALQDGKRIRTVISNDERKLLDVFYERGMTSKGHKCKQMWSEAAQSTGLHIDVVKEWIGNRRRRENLPSKKQEIKKKHYARGISAFNAFVSEHKDQLGSLGGEWASAWNGKSQEEKESYRQKAIKLNQESNGPQKTKRQLLNSIHTDMLQLARHGVTMACLGVDGIDQSTIFIGSGKAEQYFQDKNDILEKLHRFCVEDTPVLSVEQENTKSLRKRAMEHLNSLFGSAVGHPHPFPYKRVFAGEVVVKGLPEEILPLRFMSHYGEQKLKAVLACAKIEVSFPSETNIGEPGTSASDAIEEEIGENENTFSVIAV